MAEEKIDVNKLEEEIKEIIESLKKDLGKQKSSEIKEVLGDFSQSVLKEAKKINQELNNSPLANANINNSIININSREDVSKVVLEVTKLLKEVVNKKDEKTISDEVIKEVIKRIKDSIENVIKKKYTEFCKLVKSKIKELLNVISDIGPRNEEINSKIELIIQGVNTILEELSNKISYQLSILEKLLEKIDENVDELRGEISGLKKEIKELGDALISSQNEIKETLNKHSKQLKTILEELKGLHADLDQVKKRLEDINPSSLSEIYDLINKLNNKVEEVSRNVEGINDLIVEETIPVIKDISVKLGELASELPDQKRLLDEILKKTEQSIMILQSLPTRDEVKEMLDKLEERIKELIRSSRPIVRPSEPDTTLNNKKFELRWVFVKNGKVADTIKKNEIFPKQKDYVSINPYYITANLNERKKEILASDYLRKVASQIISKGFDLKKIYICLGARVVGTEKPWRWDIKHLQTSAPDIYSKLNEVKENKDAEKEEERLIRETQRALKKWEEHEHLNKNPNETLQFHISDSVIEDAEKIFNNMEELSQKYYQALGKDEVFTRHLDILGLAIKAWKNKNVECLKEYKDMPHKMLIQRLRAILNNLVNKPALPPQKDRINLYG